MSKTSKIKILFLITKSNWGGGQRYVYDLATRLDPQAFDVSCALGGNGELAINLKAAGVRVIEIPGLQRDVSFSKELKASRAIFKIIKAENPDILHVNSSKAGAIGAALGRLLGIKLIIFTALGWAFNEARPDWQKFLIKIIHWSTVLLAHKTVAISTGIKNDLNWPLVKNKMTVIPLGRNLASLADKVSARETIAAQITARTFSPEMKKDFWIGSLSELHPIKQLTRSIAAIAAVVAQYPQLRYVIIGEGQERAKLEQQIKDLNMQSHIFLAGAIFEAGQLLSAYDLFVFPSRSEAFGYVLLEAGAARLPVVASRVGGILDVVIDEETGLLFDPHDTDDLEQKIRIMLSEDARRDTLAKAHQTRSATFTIEKMVSSTLDLYTH